MVKLLLMSGSLLLGAWAASHSTETFAAVAGSFEVPDLAGPD